MTKKIFTLLALAPLAVFAGDDDEPKGPKPEARAERMMAERDKNGDGKLSPEEVPNERFFQMLDKNKDGFVTSDELKGMGDSRGKGRGKGGGKANQGDRADPERMQRMVDGMMKRLDKNGDGKVGADEMPQGDRFDLSKADTNSDGSVDRKELTAFLAQRGARRGGGDPLQRLMQMDTNKDGAIGKDEWKGRPEAFARIDKDKNGSLSKAELEGIARDMRRRGQWKNRPADALFRRMDKDGDKRISAEEWTMRAELFAKFDADGDGFIVAAEVMPKRGRRGARYDVGSGKDSAAFLQRYDKNGDGSVDKSEFAHERRFKEIDADGNGVLSRAEVEQSLDKVRSEQSLDFIERFDLDRDGKVTREEFTGPARVFESKDSNFDGVIDESDLTKTSTKRKK